MNNHENKPGEVKTLLRNQAILTALITLTFVPFGTELALSAMLGGAIVIFTGIITSLMMFKKYRAQQPEKMVAGFYGAEIAKLIITMAAFALIVLNIESLNFLTLLTVFFIIQVVPAIYLAARK
jgi:ATP synthase protein I